MRRRTAHSGNDERNGSSAALTAPPQQQLSPSVLNPALAAAAAGVPTTGTFSGGLIRYPVPVTKQVPPPAAANPLHTLLGLHQLRTAEAWRAACIEFVATTLMTFMSIGAHQHAGSAGVLLRALLSVANPMRHAMLTTLAWLSHQASSPAPAHRGTRPCTLASRCVCRPASASHRPPGSPLADTLPLCTPPALMCVSL